SAQEKIIMLSRPQKRIYQSNGGVRRARRLCLEPLEDRLAPAMASWVGNGDGLTWGDPQNWSGNALPTAADDVIINTSADDVIIHDSGTDSIHSLQSQNGLLLSGGSLTIADVSSINNTLTLSAATLTTMGNLILVDLLQSDGELNGAGTVTISRQWSFSGGD